MATTGPGVVASLEDGFKGELDGWMMMLRGLWNALNRDFGLDWIGMDVDSVRDHGHAPGSRRSELTNYLGEKPWWDTWNSTDKPLLLVDPNWTLIGQLPSSIHHPLGGISLGRGSQGTSSLP